MKLTELKLWNFLLYEIVKLHSEHYLNQRNVAISHRKTAAFQSTHLIEFRNVPTSLISINLVFRWRIWITVLQSATMLLELYKKKNISRPVTTYFHLHRQSWPNIIFSLWYDFHFGNIMILNLQQLKVIVIEKIIWSTVRFHFLLNYTWDSWKYFSAHNQVY